MVTWNITLLMHHHDAVIHISTINDLRQSCIYRTPTATLASGISKVTQYKNTATLAAKLLSQECWVLWLSVTLVLLAILLFGGSLDGQVPFTKHLLVVVQLKGK
eukprot:14564733-Ditylum_brightwellii.AAC.1